ncbi:unnamed protein product [Coregonus sp. 'balchen']|nr:unnamed protein product [Coregonus sp. 'balchen']
MFPAKLGLQKDYTYHPVVTEYFRVGSDGNCSTINCNGVLPVGSTAKFKYVLINPANKTVVAESGPTTSLFTLVMKDPDSINYVLAGRSVAMIVLTSILCAFLALLLCCWKEKQTIQVPGSLRMYATPSPYVNRAYEDEPQGTIASLVSLDYIPEILPYEASGRVTSSTIVLGQPLCYFNTLTQLKCSQSTCQVWAAIASGPGVNNFDIDKLEPVQIVSASPYPMAFSSQTNRMYFVTKLGRPKDFPCGQLPGIKVKYILIDPVSRGVVSESKWSYPISLTSMKSWSSIDEFIGKRSGGMVVITVISSCLLAVLLLLLGAVLLLDCLGSFRRGHDITT